MSVVAIALPPARRAPPIPCRPPCGDAIPPAPNPAAPVRRPPRRHRRTAGNSGAIVVTAKRLDDARASIQPSLGATSYGVDQATIQALPGGDNQQLNQLILQVPGVVQDGFGQLHVRDDHNGLEYRINGTILPEGLAVFGQTLSPRLINSFNLLTGALPAQYGLRTAGIIDITTKTGFDNKGEVSLYGGSHGTIEPSVDLWRLDGLDQLFRLGQLHAQRARHRERRRLVQPDPRQDRPGAGLRLCRSHPRRRRPHLLPRRLFERLLPDPQSRRAAADERLQGRRADRLSVQRSQRAADRAHRLRRGLLAAQRRRADLADLAVRALFGAGLPARRHRRAAVQRPGAGRDQEGFHRRPAIGGGAQARRPAIRCAAASSSRAIGAPATPTPSSFPA